MTVDTTLFDIYSALGLLSIMQNEELAKDIAELCDSLNLNVANAA